MTLLILIRQSEESLDSHKPPSGTSAIDARGGKSSKPKQPLSSRELEQIRSSPHHSAKKDLAAGVSPGALMNLESFPKYLKTSRWAA